LSYNAYAILVSDTSNYFRGSYLLHIVDRTVALAP